MNKYTFMDLALGISEVFGFCVSVAFKGNRLEGREIIFSDYQHDI